MPLPRCRKPRLPCSPAAIRRPGGGRVRPARACSRVRWTSHRRSGAAVAGVPGPHRFAHPFARPFARDRAGMAFLAVGVSVPFAVARAGRRSAAATDAPVARLDLPCLLARRVIQVRLDRRLRAPEPTSDLSDRETLLVAVMARERCRPAAILDTVCDRHRRRRYHSRWFATERAGEPHRAKGDCRPALLSASNRLFA